LEMVIPPFPRNNAQGWTSGHSPRNSAIETEDRKSSGICTSAYHHLSGFIPMRVGFTPYWNGMKWALLKYGLPMKKTHMVLEFYPTENIPWKITWCLFVLVPMWSCPKMGYTPHMAILLVWRFKENPARFISNVNPGLIDHGLLITGILPK
jgi:hypothetical protein